MAIRQISPKIENAAGSCFDGKITGGTAVPGGIRTHDLPLRRRTLYPAELQKHFAMSPDTRSADIAIIHLCFQTVSLFFTG